MIIKMHRPTATAHSFRLARTCCSVCASKAAVGSSRIRIGAFLMTARAITRRLGISVAQEVD